MMMTKENPAETSRKLRVKTVEFIRLYTDIHSETHGNATKSYIKAGYSPKGAGQSAFDLLNKPEVRQIIDRIEQDRAKAIDWDLPKFYRELNAIYEALPPTHTNKLKTVELIGKSKGWLKDNEVTINHLSVSGDDIAKLRKSLQAKGLQLEHTTNSTEGNEVVLDIGGVVERVGEPPATPLDMHTTTPQNAQQNKEPEGK